jgi:hypothetical protein
VPWRGLASFAATLCRIWEMGEQWIFLENHDGLFGLTALARMMKKLGFPAK